MPARCRLPLVVVALALVAIPAQGCGGGGSAESDSAQITKLSRDFLVAAKDGKWDEVCDTLSRHAKAEVAQAGVLMGKTGCDEVMKSAGDLDAEASYTKIDPDDVRVSNLKVTGDRAVADVTPTVDGEDPSSQFIKEDGHWKVFSLDSSSGT